MDLFMIRLENGDSVVLQAQNEEQALEFVGLRVDVKEVAADFAKGSGEEMDPAEVHLALINSGTGPQHFTIRKLGNFMCTFKLNDRGNFEGHLGDAVECADEFYIDYPILQKMVDGVDFTGVLESGRHRERYEQNLKEAIEQERNRLLTESLNRTSTIE